MSSVGIAIVNWNAGAQLDRCLAPIAATRWDAVSLDVVVVVDNTSTDGSIERLNPAASLPLEIIRSTHIPRSPL